MVISQATITSKRQITLPIKILHRLGLNPGDPVVFEEKKGRIELVARSSFSVDDLARKYRVVSSKKASDKEIRKAREDAWTKGPGQ